MKIAYDLRSISAKEFSGVENYSLNLLKNLILEDKQNEYLLFSNSFKAVKKKLVEGSNVKNCESRIPNKFLNLAFKLNLKNLEDFTGPVDWFFMPNLNQFKISKKTKLALTVHDLSPLITPEFYNIKRRIWHSFLNYKKAFQRADLLFAVSEYTKQDLLKLFPINEDKIKVVYPGISLNTSLDLNNLENLRGIRNIYGLPGDYFLFVNTIEPRKNLSGLLKAFEQIKSSTSLVIVGKPGWNYKVIFKEINSHKKRAKIKYLGYVPEFHKPAIIKMSKALVYPSFYEGFGFQPVEAMTLGVPVIASQVTAIPEVVSSAAVLVDPYNVEMLAKIMDQISFDANLRNKLGDLGKERANFFSWRESANKVINYIKQAS